MNQLLGRALEVEKDWAAAAERLRAVTVQVRGRGRRGETGSGSGILWRPGVVVTNAHVVGARSVVVQTADGLTSEAEVAEANERQDLAVLRVSTGERPTAAIGSVATLRVGAVVLAVGHPFGLTGAVTTGVVHALAERRHRVALILADLRLLPGNSGGPLGDALGRVVGVNAMVLRGLAGAIPSDTVERFLDRARRAA